MASELLADVAAVIEHSQTCFAGLLESALSRGVASKAQYVRYLSMQYHLTKGVQRYFLAAAAHHSLAKRRALRRFLVDFANEEELHYLVAASDLLKLGETVLPEPLDVTLWHAYFTAITPERPFIRLGAAVVLENISGGSARQATRRALAAPFLTAQNSKFLVLHQHETLPHGDQILEALESTDLDAEEMSDLLLGAKQGMVLYLRMAEWALRPQCLAALAEPRGTRIPEAELRALAEIA
jgi:hypothetical protein